MTLNGIVISGDGGRRSREEVKSVELWLAAVQVGQEKWAKEGGILMPLLGSDGKK
jgi:hypothetical protein